MGNPFPRHRRFTTAVALAGYALLAVGSTETAGSKANSAVGEVSMESDARLINGEMDAGMTVSFTLTNKGERGVIQVRPRLSCSEGEWSREQNLTFEAGQSETLTYFFHEPTINATGCQAGVRTAP